MKLKPLIKNLCSPIVWGIAKIIKKALFALLKKSYYSCDPIENFQLVFYPNKRIRFCCMKYDEFADICTFDDIKGNYSLIFNKGVKKLNKIKKQFRKGKINGACLKCPNLCKNTWSQNKKQTITSINLSHYIGCNLKCVYCGWVNQKENKTTDSNLVLDSIIALKDNNYLANNCSISVGGGHGEPSLHQGISMITEYCVANKIFIDIHSNAARYIELFAKACESDSGQLVISSDAGSVEVFKKIKQVDDFANTWTNIQKYMENTTKNVYVKYLIQPDNMYDYNDFINCCIKHNVRIIIIDLVVGMECDKTSIINSVRNLRMLCEQNKIEYKKGGFLPYEYYAEKTVTLQ